MNNFLLYFFLVFLVTGKAFAAEKPNILLIMSDDQGWGDFSLHGNKLIDTPYLNQLASESLRFDKFYVSPVCAPTRASLLTGRHYPRTGVHGVTRRKETMRAEEITLAEILQKNGYRTGIFGKWHNGNNYPYDPNGQGFDEFWGFTSGIIRNYHNARIKHNQETVESNGYITDFLTDKAIEFMDKHSNQPFFCYIPYNVPHTPIQVSHRFYDKYLDRGLEPYDAGIYAMVEAMDEQIGRLIYFLNQRNLRKNTIIIFLTDNGPNGFRYNGGMKGKKGSVDEGGIRVPLWIHWQDQIIPELITQPADQVDILPTILDFCMIPLPDSLKLDGVSLKSMIDLQSGWPERYIYTSRKGNQPYPGSIRNSRYRLTMDDQGQYALYDLVCDPSQHYDISSRQASISQKMFEAYHQWYKEVSSAGFEIPPVHIGHPGYPNVELPAVGALISPGLAYKFEHGWAYDWVVDWDHPSEYLEWDIKVITQGTYQVELQYASQKSGATISVEVGDQKISRKIKQAFMPTAFLKIDLVDRGRPSEMKWKDFSWGTMKLAPGKYKLSLKLTDIPPGHAVELYGIKIRKLE
ncbi:MAG: sulfatase-like hydrolase/transferase [Candidatus Cyclobacteriaceae bacterium M3_2C_046]